MTILFLHLHRSFSFDWQDISNTRDSVSSAIQMPQILSKILHRASCFQLSSWCLEVLMKHCLLYLMYYFSSHQTAITFKLSPVALKYIDKCNITPLVEIFNCCISKLDRNGCYGLHLSWPHTRASIWVKCLAYPFAQQQTHCTFHHRQWSKCFAGLYRVIKNGQRISNQVSKLCVCIGWLIFLANQELMLLAEVKNFSSWGEKCQAH